MGFILGKPSLDLVDFHGASSRLQAVSENIRDLRPPWRSAAEDFHRPIMDPAPGLEPGIGDGAPLPGNYNGKRTVLLVFMYIL